MTQGGNAQLGLAPQPSLFILPRLPTLPFVCLYLFSIFLNLLKLGFSLVWAIRHWENLRGRWHLVGDRDKVAPFGHQRIPEGGQSPFLEPSSGWSWEGIGRNILCNRMLPLLGCQVMSSGGGCTISRRKVGEALHGCCTQELMLYGRVFSSVYMSRSISKPT